MPLCDMSLSVAQCAQQPHLSGCCAHGSVCSATGCVLNSTLTEIYISNAFKTVALCGSFLFVIGAGVVDFMIGCIYYSVRRRREREHITRSRQTQTHMVVNARSGPTEVGAQEELTSSARHISELDGMCCGCGSVANTVLLPCLHAVCCTRCSERAPRCPLCNTVCEGKQRLFQV
ncbi:hypothetical protein STCU_00200 [Strigomonas culicis]|uniref:RING-type domain-containing protein n=1 Tax=Strigomonas culicis TaxID=28005 RepID=S9V221_9TRYP|nr:hypothetical protein STCU_00200 [Strigomonas culicis]|eukprot:EPY37097.1 hypothetical protein STCU_00200 [Strigomonas culicis]